MHIVSKYLLLVLSVLFLLIPSPSSSQTPEEIEIVNKTRKEIWSLMHKQEFEEALSMWMQARDSMAHYLRNDPLIYAEWLGMAGVTHYVLDRHKLGIEYYQKALEVLEENKLYGVKYAEITQYIAIGYRNINDFEKAFTYAFRSLEMFAIEPGKETLRYADALSIIGNICLIKGDIREAMRYFEESIEIAQNTEPDNKIQYATMLSWTAIAYQEMGLAEKALELQLESDECIAEVFGENHISYAVNILTTAEIYRSLGDLEKALFYTRQAMEIYPQSAKNISMYARALHNFSSIYAELGDYWQALKYDEEALQIINNIRENKTLEYYTTLVNIGTSYQNIGNYEKALEYFSVYKAGVEEIAGKNNLMYIHALENLGLIYQRLNKHTHAIPYLEEGIAIMQSLDLLDHPSTAGLYHDIASIHLRQGLADEAINTLKAAIDILTNVYGMDSPIINVYLNSLALAYFFKEEYANAADIYTFIIPQIINELTTNFLFLTENEREKFRRTTTELYKNLSYAALHHYPGIESSKINYDLALFSKGLLLNSSIEFDKLLRESGDEQLIKEYEYLRAIRTRLNSLYEKPVPDIKEELTKLQEESNRLERELLEAVKKQGYYTDNLTASWTDIREQLSDEDLCIEFIDFEFNDTIYYGALVLSKEMEYPCYEPLFKLDELENILTISTPEEISKAYKNPVLYELIWAPLSPWIGIDKKNIYFSTSGLLHQLPIEHLAVAEDVYISDIVNLHRLSSTRQLLTESPAVTPKTAHAVLYGGLDYNTSPDRMLEYAQQYDTRGRVRLLNLSASPHQILWRYLPGTLKEVRSIASMLESLKIPSTVYTDQEGVEESFKALSGRSPQILHIATHGFYFREESPYVEKNPLQQPGESKEYTLYHAGLVFSGANNFREKNNYEFIPMDDGILTAKEIAELDLHNTELVVLSACQTGLGEITGEGVFGLQRAFKKAGAGTLLMSLWEVHDEATQVMMTEFYNGMLNGLHRREALYHAQQKVKERTFKMNGITYSGSDPYFWAGFIMLD